MKGLLIKDFKLMKGQKNFFLAIVAIALAMITLSPGTSFAIGFLGFVGSLFSLSSISYDEFDNGNAFLFSLPITQRVCVRKIYFWSPLWNRFFIFRNTHQLFFHPHYRQRQSPGNVSDRMYSASCHPFASVNHASFRFKIWR